MNDKNFNEVLEETKKAACETLKLVVDKIQGTHKVSNYRQMFEQMLKVYGIVECRPIMLLHD
jgi:hypothetical protein